MIKAAIFDVGGVLHDTSGENIINDVVSSLELDREALEGHWQELIEQLGLGKIDEGRFWKSLSERLDITKPLPKESFFLREFVRLYGIHQEVLDLVKKLHNNGCKTAVLSNTITPHVNYQRSLGIYEGFDVVVLSNEVGMLKPDKKIFNYTLKALEVRPNEAFFVDDRQENVEAAERFGIHGILYEGIDKLETKLRKFGIINLNDRGSRAGKTYQ